METNFDVVGIGNAIVDVLVEVEDSVPSGQGVEKGSMNLIDEAGADRLVAAFPAGVSCSGGSAANTIVGISQLGGRTAYVGRVRNDVLGERFGAEIREAGVSFRTEAAQSGPGTARCVILMTPDAQRTMLTYLGACADLSPVDIHEDQVAAGRILYLEGYLWDPPEAKEAFLKAARIAHDAGNRVALSLSDSFCVDRHRESFLELVEHHIDILFANEEEICSLYREDSFESAARHVTGHCEVAALTRGAEGAVLLEGDRVFEIGTDPHVDVVDTTGAGDLFAGGLLFGLSQGYGLSQAGQIGAVAAGEVISHVGARPREDLARRVLTRLHSIHGSERTPLGAGERI